MKLIVQLQLVTNQDQRTALEQTLRRANAACNWLSEQAWQAATFRQFAIHKLAYHPAREKFSDLARRPG